MPGMCGRVLAFQAKGVYPENLQLFYNIFLLKLTFYFPVYAFGSYFRALEVIPVFYYLLAIPVCLEFWSCMKVEVAVLGFPSE